MGFKSNEIVTKVSVSNMELSLKFFTSILGFEIDDNYTINVGKNFGQDSYVQLYMRVKDSGTLMLGLYKDLDRPLNPKPAIGTVPSFIVADIEETLAYLKSKKVNIDNDLDPIITNTSDKGYEDRFFFFRDPDNNSFVIRENMNR
ncbi:MAG TPA: VOC family protein [Lunatimonas sp.]|nr:VOC family protein [Lunatimonas sp.]